MSRGAVPCIEIQLARPMIHACTDGDRSLDAAQIWRGMKYNLMPPSSFRMVLLWICPIRTSSISAVFSVSNDACNSCTERLGLFPSAVGQRRVIRCWGGQMPLWVSGVESSAMPICSQSEKSGSIGWMEVAYLTTKITDGGLAMFVWLSRIYRCRS